MTLLYTITDTVNAARQVVTTITRAGAERQTPLVLTGSVAMRVAVEAGVLRSHGPDVHQAFLAGAYLAGQGVAQGASTYCATTDVLKRSREIAAVLADGPGRLQTEFINPLVQCVAQKIDEETNQKNEGERP